VHVWHASASAFAAEQDKTVKIKHSCFWCFEVSVVFARDYTIVVIVRVSLFVPGESIPELDSTVA